MKKELWKQIGYSSLACIMGALFMVFGYLAVDLFQEGQGFIISFFIFQILILVLGSIFTILTVVFCFLKKETIFKLGETCLFLAALFAVLFYVLKETGFIDRFSSIEEMRDYMRNYGQWAAIIFVLLQFAQVVALPIPSTITIGAGTALFGPFLGGVYSWIGILIGSFVAFIIGRYFGYKVTAWIIGKDTLDKWLKKVQGKSNLLLTFMFLFPFFPDDTLCFVAGVTKMKMPYFIIMISLIRALTIFTTTYSMEGVLIPYTTWWGLLIWGIIFVFTVIVMILILKKGDIIEQWIVQKWNHLRGKKETKKEIEESSGEIQIQDVEIETKTREEIEQMENEKEKEEDSSSS